MKNKYLTFLLLLLCIISLFYIINNKIKNKNKEQYYCYNKEYIMTDIDEVKENISYYDGKIIMVMGYLFTGFEESRILKKKYHKINLDNQEDIDKKGICVNLFELVNIEGEKVPVSILSKSKGKKVFIIGRYNSDIRGHLNSCSGGLDSVIYLNVIE